MSAIGSRKKVIPATPLYHRYRFFEHTSKGERLAQAEFFAEHPEQLANQFAVSVKHFGSYENTAERFFDGEHATPGVGVGPITRTIELAMRLRAKGTVVPVEPSEGRRQPAPVSPAISAPTLPLAFDYIEREVTVTRTTNGEWEHHAQATAASPWTCC